MARFVRLPEGQRSRQMCNRKKRPAENLRGVFASVLFFSRTAAFGHLDVQEDRGLHASAPQWIYVHVFFTSVFMGSSFYEIGLGRNHPMTISVKEKRGTENVWG